MGLDGGTIVTRTDVLRGSSWRLANQDDGRQRSTRGGQLTHQALCATPPLRTPAYNRCRAAPQRPQPRRARHARRRRPARPALRARRRRRIPDVDGPIRLRVLRPRRAHRHVWAHRAAARRLRGDADARAHGDAAAKAEGAPPWCCAVDPATETNGRHAFVALTPCGHVVGERAWKAAGGGGACPWAAPPPPPSPSSPTPRRRGGADDGARKLDAAGGERAAAEGEDGARDFAGRRPEVRGPSRARAAEQSGDGDPARGIPIGGAPGRSSCDSTTSDTFTRAHAAPRAPPRTWRRRDWSEGQS